MNEISIYDSSVAEDVLSFVIDIQCEYTRYWKEFPDYSMLEYVFKIRLEAFAFYYYGKSGKVISEARDYFV